MMGAKKAPGEKEMKRRMVGRRLGRKAKAASPEELRALLFLLHLFRCHQLDWEGFEF